MKSEGMKINRRQALKSGLAASAAFLGTHRLLAQDAPYRFGLALPLTGPQASYGGDQIQAAQWAVVDINKAGGVNGKKLEMVVLDTQADPQVGIQAINRLVNVEKVPALITAWSVVVKGDAHAADWGDDYNEADVAGLRPWVATRKPVFVRVTPSQITGRTFLFGPEPEGL